MSLYVAIYIFQNYKLALFQGNSNPDLIFASYVLRGVLLILVSMGGFLLGIKHIMYPQSSAVLVGAYASFSATALFHAFLLISNTNTTQGYVSYAIAACSLAQAILLLFIYTQDMYSGSGADTGAGMRSPTLIFLSVLHSASCIMLGAVYSYSYTQLKANPGTPQLYLDYAVGTAVYFFFFAVVLIMPSFTRGYKGTIYLTLAATSFIVGMMSLIDGLFLNSLIGFINNVPDTIDASYAGAAAEFLVFVGCFGMGMYDYMNSGKSAS